MTKGVPCKTLNNFWEPRQKPQCQENVVLLAVVSTSCKIIFMSTPFWLLWRQENLLLFPIVFWPPTKTILLIHHFGSQTWQSSMLDSLPAPSLLWCVKKLLHWNLCDVHWSSDSIILLIHAFLLLVWVSPFREDGRLYLSKKKKGFLYFRWASWKCDKQSDLVFDPFGFVQGLNLRYCIHQSDSHLYFCSLVDSSVIVFT